MKKRFEVKRDTYKDSSTPWDKTRYVVVDSEGYESPAYFSKKSEAVDYADEQNEENDRW